MNHCRSHYDFSRSCRSRALGHGEGGPRTPAFRGFLLLALLLGAIAAAAAWGHVVCGAAMLDCRRDRVVFC